MAARMDATYSSNDACRAVGGGLSNCDKTACRAGGGRLSNCDRTACRAGGGGRGSCREYACNRRRLGARRRPCNRRRLQPGHVGGLRLHGLRMGQIRKCGHIVVPQTQSLRRRSWDGACVDGEQLGKGCHRRRRCLCNRRRRRRRSQLRGRVRPVNRRGRHRYLRRRHHWPGGPSSGPSCRWRPRPRRGCPISPPSGTTTRRPPRRAARSGS